MKLRLAVHLHLHYISMWPEMKSYLANIKDYPYDLFVTLTVENTEIEKDIKSFKSDAKIWIVENRGYDIGPFIDFLHHIDLNKYDLVMKLHTKNKFNGVDTHINNYVFSRKLWFKVLTRSLIGSSKIFMKNIKEFQKYPELGMVGSKYLIASDTETSSTVSSQVGIILNELGLSSKYIKFVAGTMFICRSNILDPLKKYYTIVDFPPTNGKIKDGTLAHAIERVMGCLATAQGYKIKGFDKSLPHSYRLNLQPIARFIYQHKITKTKHEQIKVFKLPIYHRKLL